MPKEKIKLDDTDSIKVGWSKEHDYVEVGVDIGTPFIIVDSLEAGASALVYTDLWATFQTKKDLDKFIRALMRARKQAFGKS